MNDPLPHHKADTIQEIKGQAGISEMKVTWKEPHKRHSLGWLKAVLLTLLMVQSFNTVFRVVVTPTHNIIFIATS